MTCTLKRLLKVFAVFVRRGCGYTKVGVLRERHRLMARCIVYADVTSARGVAFGERAPRAASS